MNYATLIPVLQNDPAQIAWRDRVGIAKALSQTIAAGRTNDTETDLLEVLGRDPKWEVRKAATESLLHLPADDFLRHAPRLAADSNVYVARAATRAIDQRRRLDSSVYRVKRDEERLAEVFQAIESKHGKQAAKRAWTLAQRYNELLVKSMVHDIRSILAYVTPNAEKAAKASTRKPDAQKSAATIARGCEHLRLMLEDMMALTQPLTTDRHAVRLDEIVAEAVEMARENARFRDCDPDGVAIDCRVPASIVVRVARHLVVKALVNVITNALEATEEQDGARITIRAHRSSGVVTIRIHDNGSGLAPEEEQALSLAIPGRRNKTKKFSTGYGLPIARRSFEVHGGTLQIRGRENAGTTVTIELPITHSIEEDD